MLEHFKDYNDIVGDHPQNLAATSLALNAYMLTHEREIQGLAARVRRRLAPAHARQRRDHPHQHRPRRHDRRRARRQVVRRRLRLGIHRDRAPDRASPSIATSTTSGLNGFGNAYLLTGDDRYLDAWRKQIDAVNAQAKAVETAGRSTPTCTATRAGTITRRSRTRTGRSSSTTGR